MRATRVVRLCVGVSMVCAMARPAVAQSPPPPAQPVPLAVNGQLAQWLQVRGEFRARTEGFDGGGFSATNEDAYWLERFRLNATVKPAQALTFFIQAQDARAFNKRTGGMAVPFRDTISMRQAYGEGVIGSRVAVRIGRQELSFGEQRLIGALPWTNAARSFDAARLTIRQTFGQLDAFAASVVTIAPDGFDKSGNGNALYGLYNSLTTLIPKQVVEPYLLVRRSPNLEHGTAGIRVAGRLPAAFDYSMETAIQRGTAGADDLHSWAGHALVGRSFPAALKPRAFGEFNYGSSTFDQLYPTGHDKFGLADQIGWRNITHIRAGLEVTPTTRLQIAASVHDFRLTDAAGGLYTASGALVTRSVTGTAGTHVGREIDIQTAYVYSAQLQVAAGYAYLAPGDFLKNTTAGHGYSYPFVMATYVFLGESPTFGGRKK